MKILNFIIFTLLFALFFSVNVVAFMPNTHRIVWEESMKTSVDSEFYKACIKYPDLCYSGNVLSDVSVIFYYTARGKYTTTHSPSFCKKMLDNVARVPGEDPEKMRACAIGACTHQSSDIVSHSQMGSMDGMVAYSIKHSFIANQVIHVFAEQHLDNYVESQDKYSVPEYKKSLEDGYKECQPLFVLSMMGENLYQGMTKSDLDNTFDTFITEIVNSQTGYDTAFKDKSFFVTLKSIPFSILAIYITFMAIFLLISLLLTIKIIKRDSKLRHIIGLIIFLPLLLIMAYLLYGTIQGSAFNTFIGFIKPFSNLVPIGDSQTWIDLGIKNTKDLMQNGEQWLEGTDASGLGTNPVLNVANSNILPYDYIFLIILVLFLIWFIWFLFKKNKIKIQDGFGL